MELQWSGDTDNYCLLCEKLVPQWPTPFIDCLFCSAGTLVDSGVCHPFEYDFFLNSHTGLKGTNSPTHYHVIHDENKLVAAELHVMTYKYGTPTCIYALVNPFASLK